MKISYHESRCNEDMKINHIKYRITNLCLHVGQTIQKTTQHKTSDYTAYHSDIIISDILSLSRYFLRKTKINIFVKRHFC